MNANRTRAIVYWLFVATATGFAVRADDPDRTRLETEAMGQAAEADRLFKAGEYAAALPLYEAERTSRAALKDLRYEAYAARGVGCCRERLGDIDGAIVSWSAARVLDARRDDRGFEGFDWFLIGQAELRRARYEAAAAALERSLPLLSQAIDRDHEADARRLLAQALIFLRRPDAALPHLERSLALAQSLGDPGREASALAELARLEGTRGNTGAAAEWAVDARETFSILGRESEAAALDRILGDVLLDLGCPDAAVARVETAAETHQRLDDPAALGGDLQFLAQERASLGNLRDARDLARRAAAAWARADDPPHEIDALVGLARFESQLDGWAAADTVLSRALGLARQSSEPADHVRILILAAGVHRRARPDDRSTALLDEADAVARKTGDAELRRAVEDARSGERR